MERRAHRRVLLFFIDGIGVGASDPSLNPLASGTFPLFQLTRDTSPVSSSAGRPAMAHGLDASLGVPGLPRSEEHTSELQSQSNLVCRLLLEKKKQNHKYLHIH